MSEEEVHKFEATGISVRPASNDIEAEAEAAGLVQRREGALGRVSHFIRVYTPAAFLVAYLVFSISLYVLVDSYATKVFWFLYLSISMVLACTTALEAYDGLTPLREARKARRNLERNEWKFKGDEDALPHVELIFDDVTARGRDWASIESSIRGGIEYPADKVHITALCSHQNYHIDVDGNEEFRRIWLPEGLANGIGRFQSALELTKSTTKPAVTVLLSGSDRLHPHALRFAVDRLVQNAKVQIVQGRSVLASHQSSSPISTLASIQHDMTHALIKPGRNGTWNFGVASGYGSVWRTSALQDAIDSLTRSNSPPADVSDLAWAAYANGSKAVHDLSAIIYSPSPRTLKQYLHLQVKTVVQNTKSTASWSKLIFTRAPKDRPQAGRTLQNRSGLAYSLPVQVIAAHTVLQLLSWCLALLFTRTPRSSSDLATAMYWFSPVSRWFTIVGAICTMSTVCLAFKARSDSVSVWTLPIAIVTYPALLALSAAVAVYGQMEAIAR